MRSCCLVTVKANQKAKVPKAKTKNNKTKKKKKKNQKYQKQQFSGTLGEAS